MTAHNLNQETTGPSRGLDRLSEKVWCPHG
jgi:hypothetical protein